MFNVFLFCIFKKDQKINPIINRSFWFHFWYTPVKDTVLNIGSSSHGKAFLNGFFSMFINISVWNLKNNLVIINGEVMELEIIALSARNDKMLQCLCFYCFKSYIVVIAYYWLPFWFNLNNYSDSNISYIPTSLTGCRQMPNIFFDVLTIDVVYEDNI